MKFLFVGNFFIHTRGTSKPVSHRVVDKLKEDGRYQIEIGGIYSNKILRVLDILVKSLFFNYSTIHIDVFSGKSIYLALLPAVVGKMRSKTVLLNLRGGALQEYSDLNPKLIGYLFGRADKLISPSKFLINYYSSKSFQVEYLPNYVEFKVVARVGVQADYSLLWVRAFTKIYNPKLSILALEKLVINYPQIKLTMLGPDLGMLAACKDLAKTLNLSDRINFGGPIKYADLPSFYLSHTVFLNTTSFESFGNAVLEAAHFGLPTVSSKVGEIPYLWTDGKDICLVDSLNADDFSSKIKLLFEDEKLRRLIAKNAQEKARQFSWENIKFYWFDLLSVK